MQYKLLITVKEIMMDGWIKYKDPNRGNYEYTVNWNQFKQFANEKSLYLFSYKSANEVPQIISD